MHTSEKEDLSNPLARARGLGSAKEGVHHWWWQRVTSVALVPLSLWFVYSLLTLLLSHSTPAMLAAWLGVASNALLMLLFLLSLFWHSSMGIQVIIEDYVHTPGLKLLALLTSKFLHFGLAAMAVMAIAKLHFLPLAPIAG